MNKLLIAKSLRGSFNEMQADLLTLTYMDDEYLLSRVKEMQEVYSEFSKLANELKTKSPEEYNKLLGM